MKSLIVEDDFTSSLLLQEILKQIGPVDVASNGVEAVAAASRAVESGEPYTAHMPRYYDARHGWS